MSDQVQMRARAVLVTDEKLRKMYLNWRDSDVSWPKTRNFWIVSVVSTRPWAQKSFGSNDQFLAAENAFACSIDQAGFNFIAVTHT
jgi:hypothetical protein